MKRRTVLSFVVAGLFAKDGNVNQAFELRSGIEP